MEGDSLLMVRHASRSRQMRVGARWSALGFGVSFGARRADDPHWSARTNRLESIQADDPDWLGSNESTRGDWSMRGRVAYFLGRPRGRIASSSGNRKAVRVKEKGDRALR